MRDRLDQLFDLLDRWRHLPAYQLERRADILFAIYLPTFLADHLNVDIRAELIPEFPVRLGSIYPDLPAQNQNLSCKIDYIAFSKDGSTAWFIELKTDSLSRRERQDDYLRLAQQVGLPTLVDGMAKLFLKSSAKNKYYHLLTLLESLELLSLPTGFHDRAKTGLSGVAADIAASKINRNSPAISIIYLQPTQTEPGEIGFKTFADWLGRFKDPLSQKFSASLNRWAATPAGVLD